MSLPHDDPDAMPTRMAPVVTPLPDPTAASDGPGSGAGGPGSLPIGSILADRYRLERVLGAGAMGSVYLVEHVQLRKRYALKLLHPEVASPEIIARFEREAVAAANIAHEGVTAATDFGRLPDGTFFLVLEYVPGQSLRSVLAHQGAMVPSRALRIVRQVLRALGAAHAKGVIHRDIKPENVMLLDPDDASGAHSMARLAGEPDVVKVLDFGIAKLDGAGGEANGLTRAGALYGTPTYMAPEQATGGALDFRCDLYACGVMLYELIAGEPPYNADGLLVLAQHVHEPIPRARSPLGAPIGPKLQAFLDALLAKEREARPYDAAAAIGMLEDALAESKAAGAADLTGQAASLSALAPPSALSTRVDDWVAGLARRVDRPKHQVRRALLIGAAALAVLLVVSLVSIVGRGRNPDDFASFSGIERRMTRAVWTAPGVADAPVAPASSAGAPASASASSSAAPSASVSNAATVASANPGSGGGKRSLGGKGFGRLKSIFR
jgi:tRNA A-37 threonylcarbamoyl transferase component Bud32